MARASEFEVFFRELKAVGDLLNSREAFKGLGRGGVCDEEAVRFGFAPSDTAAKLVELSKAEAVGLFDDHDGGVWNIDANFDDGGGNEAVYMSGSKAFHDGFAQWPSELAVEDCDACQGEQGSGKFHREGGYISQGRERSGQWAYVW